MPEIITHGKCGKQWTGKSRCHCSRCHETFSSLSAFDRHWVGAVGRDCRKPSEVGLLMVPGPLGGIWSWPSDGLPFGKEKNDG